MSPSRIGPYRILRSLGEGGMGAVYEAIHESIERRVALKVLHAEHARSPDAVSRFFNEARAVNRIEHPSIVQVSEFGQADDGTAYLVMEFLRGETLSRRLDRLAAAGRRMSPVEAVQIAAQLADALSAAHEKGIVHRDLKPANVMLAADALSPAGERVKLLDFGIAKLTQQKAQPGKATATNALMGTPQYMSPEQCRGAGGVDDRTDVYALGVILFECVAGRPPFLAQEPLGYLTQHAYKSPPPLTKFAPKAPSELSALVQRLLSKDKTARPSMREVCAKLISILTALGGSASVVQFPSASSTVHVGGAGGVPSTLGDSLGQTVRRRPIRRKAIYASAIMGVLAVGWLTLRLLTPSPSAPAAATQPSLPLRNSLPGKDPPQPVQPIGPIDPLPTTSAPSALPVPSATEPTVATSSHRPTSRSASQSLPTSRPSAVTAKQGHVPPPSALPRRPPPKFVD